MQIKKSIKQEDGTYEIQGYFTEEEYNYILEVGLSVLVEAGELPFAAVDPAQLSLDFSQEIH